MSDFSVPTECQGFAAMEASGKFTPFTFTRRACGANDIVIDVKFAGICHSDIHQVREEWGSALFPMVPGHEIGGVIVAVGANVTNYTIGDHAGVGCMVDSCRSCRSCKKGSEQYCTSGCVWTYNGVHKYEVENGTRTYGGYSKHIVVDKNFALKIPKSLDLAGATPLMCAGITVYSPMLHFGLQPNMKFGVVGLGGLGHMAVKFGVAFGCHTTVISRGNTKRDGALNDLHATAFLNSNSPEDMAAEAGTFDFILCTVSAQFDPLNYLKLLAVDGKFISVGVPPEKLSINVGSLVHGRKIFGGSLIGGIQETQEMLNFCGRYNITCDIEMIGAAQIDESYDRAVEGDVKYRFVIDTSTI
ncbi:adhA [Symbiodinium microadriaticum]|nr:adhA [Symbiodinium microadriaticum]